MVDRDRYSDHASKGRYVLGHNVDTVALVVAVMAFMPGCARPSGYGSPEELFQVEHRAMVNKDGAVLLTIVPSSHQNAFRRVIELTEQCTRSVDALAKQVSLKYGDDVGQIFRRKYEHLLWQSQFAVVTTDGQIDWAKVTIDRRPGMVHLRIPDNADAYAVKMSDGRWYRIFCDTGSVDDSLRALAYSEGLLQGCLRELHEIRDLVISGTYTRAEVLDRVGG
jgi:hypothetical protein